MRLTRRRLLTSASAVLPVLALPRILPAQAYAAQVSLLLDGIGPGIDPDLLQGVVRAFLDRGLPVTCIVDLVALARGTAADRRICDLLAGIALHDPGLFDLALPIGKLPRTERYFQLRRAGELRDAVREAFALGPAMSQSFPVVTLVDRVEDPNIDHTAFRGAGFRVHLRAGDGPVSRQVAGRGEMVIAGGIWTRLDTPDVEARLTILLETGDDLQLSLSLAGVTSTAEDLIARAGRLATLLAAPVEAGRILMASPARLRLYADASLPLDIALLVEPGLDPEAEVAVLEFVRDLANQGVPLTLTGRADRFGELPGTVSFCARPSTGAEGLPPPPGPCLRESPGAPPDLATAIHLGADPAVWVRQGIEAQGRLRLTLRRLVSGEPDRVLEGSPLEDHVVAIQPADLLQPVHRAELARRFVEASQSGQAYFHTVPGLAAHLVETEPVLSRLWSVRRRVVTDPKRAPAPDAAERARLVEDARLAWRYVERFTDPETGLCAGTVQMGQREVINREATMWDLASQLHAIRVARQLDLIDQTDAEARVRRLIEHLPIGKVEELNLPPAMFRTDDLAVVTPGFDICDAGRFLVALTSVVEAGLLDPVAAGLVVAGWDLAGALPEGRPHSHFDGKWIDTTLSHCTPYIRRGMAPWGFDLVSPYAGLAGGTEADRQIALFYDVAAIGQVGVEPVLLDLIELGPDPTADLIADALFDAQLGWFETTGQLKCASEAPLNFPPWFSYQGLRFGALGDAAWVVRGLGGAAEHDTAEFRAKAELLSTKSAYLWAAHRRHDWCDQLLGVIRDKTRIPDLGFSVGVFTSTLKAMPFYTDLNTNGVILAAIGHVLR